MEYFSGFPVKVLFKKISCVNLDMCATICLFMLIYRKPML